MNLFAPVSFPLRLLATALLAVASAGFCWVKGATHVQAQWDAAVVKQSLTAATVKQRQGYSW
jgi:hypothetical protein